MTLPDGTKIATEIIADLRETVCDNQGNRLEKVMLSKVRYILKNRFNLTKGLMNGWDFVGYINSIWIRKNEQTIKSDIKIKTKEGIIFAMYVNR